MRYAPALAALAARFPLPSGVALAREPLRRACARAQRDQAELRLGLKTEARAGEGTEARRGGSPEF